MDLRTAVARVAKFSESDIAKGLPAWLVLVPGNGVDQCGYVQGTDGEVVVRAYVDPEEKFPHLACAAHSLNNAFKQFKKRHVEIVRTGESAAAVRTPDDGGYFQIVAGDPSLMAPTTPATFPERLTPISGASAILRLVHVTKKVEKMRPELLYMRVEQDCVLTSDQSRIARAFARLPVPEPMLIHRDLWAKWPRLPKHAPVSFGVHSGISFLSLCDEVRWANVKPVDGFFDLETSLPRLYMGQRTEVTRSLVQQAVKFATQASDYDAVEMSFAHGKLEVCGLQQAGTKGSGNVVDAPGATGDPVRVVVRGRPFWDALSALDDFDEVVLGYSSADQPVRIEAPSHQEMIWPLIPVTE